MEAVIRKEGNFNLLVEVKGRGKLTEERVNEMVADWFSKNFDIKMEVGVPGNDGHLTNCPFYVKPEFPDAVPFVVWHERYQIESAAEEARKPGGVCLEIRWDDGLPVEKMRFELYRGK